MPNRPCFGKLVIGPSHFACHDLLSPSPNPATPQAEFSSNTKQSIRSPQPRHLRYRALALQATVPAPVTQGQVTASQGQPHEPGPAAVTPASQSQPATPPHSFLPVKSQERPWPHPLSVCLLQHYCFPAWPQAVCWALLLGSVKNKLSSMAALS